MRKYETFFDGHPATKTAVTGTGLQAKEAADSEKVWVLNGLVQYNDDGDLLDVKSSPYWLGRFSGNTDTACMQIPPHQASCVRPKKRKRAGQKLVTSKSMLWTEFSSLPSCARLRGFMCPLRGTHYHYNQVPVSILFGDVGLGMSRAALSLMGVQECNYFQEATDHRAIKTTSETTLGVVIADPTDHTVIAEKIIHHFEGGTHASAHETIFSRGD